MLKTAKKKVVSDYLASIKVLGKIYTSKGFNVRNAIENLNAGSVAKGMSILTLSKGEVSQSKILPSTQTSRLFSASHLVREISLKQIALRFDL